MFMSKSVTVRVSEYVWFKVQSPLKFIVKVWKWPASGL